MLKSLLETCDITTGKIDANAAEAYGKYPFFTCAPEPLRINHYAFDDNVILLAGNNAQGNFHITRFNGKFNAYQRTYVITAKKNYDIDYLKYSIELSLNHLKKVAQGSQTKFLTMEILRQFEVRSIPYNEQKEQVSCLVAIDDKIALNNRVNATLEAMAKTLYDFWFVQFDFPDEKGRPYKTSGGKMVYNEDFGREIPAGWEVVNIGSFVKEAKNGDWGSEQPSKIHTYQVICLRGADFPFINGSVISEPPIRFIDSNHVDRILEDGDIIIEISGGSPTQSTGRACYINDEVLKRFDKSIITSNFCKGLKMNNKEDMFFFFLTWEKLYENNVLFNFEGKTTGIKNLLFDVALDSIKIPCPDHVLLNRFNQIVMTLFQMVQKNIQANCHLSALRDWLLPMLMNGQVGFRAK